MTFDPSDPRFWGGGEKLPHNYIFRATTFDLVKLRTHHGGCFVHHPTTEYVKGRCDVDKVGWDVDEMSPIDISKYIKSFGYQSIKCVWYRHPELDLSNGLRPLNTDFEVHQFACDVRGHEYADIYVEHLIDMPVFVESKANLSDDGVQVVEDSVVGEKNIKEREKVDVEGEGNKDCDSHLGRGKDCEGVGDGVGDGVEGDSDSEDEGGEDSESEDKEDEGGEDSEIDKDYIYDTNQEKEDGDSEQLDSLSQSDEDDHVRKEFPVFEMPEDDGKINFEVGLIFNSKELVKEAMKEYAMNEKKNLHLVKNDKIRMVIRCMKGCPFYVRVSKRSFNHYFQVVRCDATHTCHGTPKNRQAKTGWLAKKFAAILRHSPDMNTKGLIAEAKERWGVELSTHKAYMAKRRALEFIQGAGSDQSNHLKSDAEEIMSNPPKSWPKIDSEPINPPLMKRAPGRSKKLRNKTNDEPQIPHKQPRQHTTVKCTTCGELGHNVRTCKRKATADRAIPKGRNKGAKRKKPSESEQAKHAEEASQVTQGSQATFTPTEATQSAPQPFQDSQGASAHPQSMEEGSEASRKKGKMASGTQKS